jgi:asparagine synthase (glutamine-hydrolysing)
MCGIYGIADLTGRHEPGQVLLRGMGEVIFHRGPDDSGQYVGRGIALGMRRLSIIDLSGGHQPISNEDGSIWVVCNGEIYNFQELRDRLEKSGHVFRCKSDTEVLVHLYEQEGLDFVKHLRGMFALALWDGNLSRLVLARDRLGKKPLYVRREPGRILFASEIKSILQDSEVPRRVDPDALREYLALGYVPAPATMFEGIEKVLPGHFLVIEKGRVQDREYWDIRFDQVEQHSEQEWIERVREKLLESVRVRMVSDVPLGAFLSGGIDSSAIVAAMSRFSDRPVKTYSIGFEGEDKYYNELPYARIVADAFRTDHHEIVVRPDVAELLPKLIWHLDEPIADSALITTYLVSRMARESVTVILSGVGGDELFGGYRRYLGEGLRRYYELLPSAVRAKWLPALLARLPQDRSSGWKNNIRYASAFVKSAQWDPVSRYLSYVTAFSPEVRGRLLRESAVHGDGAAPPSVVLKGYFEKIRDADSLHQIIYVDLKTSLADDLLALTDKMTMAASLECRAPFMDQELVELASRIPSSLKVRGLRMKYLLKKVIGPWVPREILHRKKRGFGAPMGAWLRKDLDVLVRDTLSETQIRKRGFFDPAVVQEIVKAHGSQSSDHTDHLLGLINFELWCRIFLDGNDWRSMSGCLAAEVKS